MDEIKDTTNVVEFKGRELKPDEEKFLKDEKEDNEEIKDDRCPHCGTHASLFPYVNFNPINHWVECPACGVVFAPLSIRRRKLAIAAGVQKPPSLLIPA
jgi:ribosomal protein S27AE